MSLTIIIPVYNTVKYISRCLNSLLSNGKDETLLKNNIFILAINDGSTDNSLKILENYKEKYPDIIKVISQENQGLSVARNTAIKNISTQFFSFVDSDDWIDMDKFIEAYRIAYEKNLEALIYKLDSYDEYNNVNIDGIKQKVMFNKIDTGINYLRMGYQPSSVCLMIFNSSFVKQNNLYFYQGITQQDVEFTMRFFLLSKKILFIDSIVYHYYRRLGSTTIPKTEKKLKKYLEDTIIVAQQIKKNESNELSEETNEIIQKNYNSVVWNLLWRFYKVPNETDLEFKSKCLSKLRENELYPIKGKLKTPFQKITRILMNNSLLLKRYIIRK